MQARIASSAFASARRKYPYTNFLGEFWPVYLAGALIVSYMLSAGYASLYTVVPLALLAVPANYLAYLAYVGAQKNEILGRK